MTGDRPPPMIPPEARHAPLHVPTGTPFGVSPRQRPMVLLDGQAKHAVEIGRSRLFLIAGLFALCFVMIAGRMLELALFSRPDESRVVAVEAPVERAPIADRNGQILATNLAVASLYVDTTKILDIREAVTKLSRVLPELSAADLDAKLRTGKTFVWIKRGLTPRQEWEVNSLGLPGFAFQREERRVYPYGRLAAQVLGYVDIDLKGISGTEAYFDETLRDPARHGRPLHLSLDIRVQHAVADELAKTIAHFEAIGGAGIVLDVRTGEVLAMVSLPDFDPTDPGAASADARFNRATLGVYEMGSTFKTFNTSMALDYGVTTLRGGYDATNPIRVARYTINDDHPKHRWLSVPEIFMYSSNIGSAKMALDVGSERQKAFMTRLGMTRRMTLELPELGLPLVPNPWREINTMTIAFGHGLSVTPLHLISGLATVANGGLRFQTTLLRADPANTPVGERVISSQTSAAMRRLLRLVVTGGTGRKADVPGYFVGGKTGTAEKVVGGSYAHKALLSSFISAFPMTEPRYAVLVMVDEPKGQKDTYGYATGGWTAAPATARIIERIAPMLGVLPSDGPDPVDVGAVLAIKAGKD